MQGTKTRQHTAYEDLELTGQSPLLQVTSRYLGKPQQPPLSVTQCKKKAAQKLVRSDGVLISCRLRLMLRARQDALIVDVFFLSLDEK